MGKTILQKGTIDGGIIEIRKFFFGYGIYDCGRYCGWKVTLEDAKHFGDSLSGDIF